MPIDYSNYPDNWKTHIRPAILRRAGNDCEWCGIANGAGKIGSRGQLYKVILTVAHLDHDLTNNDGMEGGAPALPLDEANLVALCQKCHLGHDAKEKARRRRENSNQLELGI